MAISYFLSSEVHVFPCAYRGTTPTLYDPEARLNTEKNFANLGNNNLKKSYVISYDDTSELLKCVIGGYYFEITCDTISKTTLANKYLAIKTIDKFITGSSGPKTEILINYEGSDVGDLDTGTPSKFKGLAVVESISEGTTAFIKPFLDSGALNYAELLPTNLKSGKAANTLDGGSENNNTGSNSLVLGQHNTNQVSDAIVVGQYASNTTAVGAKIAVGNGTSGNSFTVLADGTVDAAGTIKTNTIKKHGGTAIAIGETGDTINVNGNTTVSGTTASAGKLTVGAGGAEITGDTTIHTGDLTLDGSMKQIKVGSTVVANNMIEVAGTMGQGYVQADKINGDQLYPKTAGGDITVNTNLKINPDKKLNVNTIEKTSGAAINITSPMEAGNISTTGLTATSDANIGTSGTPFNNIYGTTLHGALDNQVTTGTHTGTEQKITGLETGYWYFVRAEGITLGASTSVPNLSGVVYVPTSGNVYYGSMMTSPSGDHDYALVGVSDGSIQIYHRDTSGWTNQASVTAFYVTKISK